jgi:hypothetical protein
MDILTTYTTGFGPVNSIPRIKGRYITRSLKTRNDAAFAAADLYHGKKQLIEPTLAQTAAITGSDVSAVWWASQREEHRREILAGLLPLVPSRQRKAPASVPVPKVDDAVIGVIRDIIGQIGMDRFLTVAAAVEAQVHH